jgi:hypothetical protein
MTTVKYEMVEKNGKFVIESVVFSPQNRVKGPFRNYIREFDTKEEAVEFLKVRK